MGGGSRYRMSIIRKPKGNVALSNLRKPHVEFKKTLCRHFDFKKGPCRMSLMPKKGRVALSILGVCPTTGTDLIKNKSPAIRCDEMGQFPAILSF